MVGNWPLYNLQKNAAARCRTVAKVGGSNVRSEQDSCAVLKSDSGVLLTV